MYEGFSQGKRRAAKALVKIILERGYNISVNDGEEWACRRCANFASIIEAIGNTGEDHLTIGKVGPGHGWFYLIWGNEEDGSTLVSDYADNEVCNDIWDKWNERFE